MINLTSHDIYVIEKICQRLKECTGFIDVYCLENIYKEKSNKLDNSIYFFQKVTNSIVVINQDNFNGKQIDIFKKNNKSKNIFIELSHTFMKNSYKLTENSPLFFRLNGLYFSYKISYVPKNFKVLAIMHVYNEGDIIEPILNYLMNQDIDVYVIDNWSKDGTYENVLNIKKQYKNRIFVERFPEKNDNNCYDWYHQLERTEQISKEYRYKYNWFIHYDADEYRVSPIKNYNLKEFIYYVDRLGFNIIENNVVVFRLTNESDQNIFLKDDYFEFPLSSGSFIQEKTWKADKNIDLKQNAGHMLIKENKKYFPLKILNRHYPFRTFSQAKKKVFIERKQRFLPAEKQIGWHTQYDSYKDEKDLIYSKENLIKWNSNTLDNNFVELFICRL